MSRVLEPHVKPDGSRNPHKLKIEQLNATPPMAFLLFMLGSWETTKTSDTKL